jgi:hypothetical protein
MLPFIVASFLENFFVEVPRLSNRVELDEIVDGLMLPLR